jgi:hypothetical protein
MTFLSFFIYDNTISTNLLWDIGALEVKGVWELGIKLDTNAIYYFLFKS